ncbi:MULTISPECIES: HAD family hydrolase [unclassified Aureispira]|uniref:HAD family hydrolase n=1 Tax=unclassified Aureispira TaxID=2649989 RepID=UPI00069704F0|nr:MULTISPECIES: HAD family hydrolase [unclassified Aureispira]WMX16062.1 HAD family hydrolase [Aureispira sp. CCB-E]
MLDGISTIYFDLDNTLIDRNAAFLACMQQFFDENMPNYYFNNEAFEIENVDQSGYTPREEFVEWFIHYYQPQGWDETSFWNYVHANISSYVPPITPALRELLYKLKQQYRIGILTNGSISNQSRKIRNAQLDSIFSTETIHIAQQYHLSKPDTQLFELILEQWKLEPQHLLYVGDDPINDIKGAAKVGIKTAWVSHKREWIYKIKPDITIEHILEFNTL